MLRKLLYIKEPDEISPNTSAEEVLPSLFCNAIQISLLLGNYNKVPLHS